MLNTELLRELLVRLICCEIPEHAYVHVEFGKECFPVTRLYATAGADCWLDTVIDAGFTGMPGACGIYVSELVEQLSEGDASGDVIIYQGSPRSYAYYHMHNGEPFRYEREPNHYDMSNILILHAGRFISGGQNDD